jgi:arabinogalactan oligomer / maltooligosaccharide transport system permease protein
MMNVGSQVPPEGARGVLFAVFTVLALFLGSLAAGWLITGGVSGILDAQNQATLDPWWILVFAGIVLAPVLFGFIRLFPWLNNWYYLLPALIFLLGFTVYPIALTLNFAFTNYSADFSGQPNSSASVPVSIVSDGGNSVKLSDGQGITNLACVNPDCVGQAIALRDPAILQQDTKRAGDTVTLDKNIRAGFKPDTMLKVNNWSYVGFENFSNIFAKASIQLIPIFVWTVIFAASTVIVNAFAGLVLGILLNNKRLKFRNFYRTILFLPWAIPGIVSIQMWQGLLNQNYGGFNRLLGLFGVNPIPWLADESWARVAIIMVNLWLGFPYQMTATLGALATIPEELYEAAEVDGATKLEQIQFITLPMLAASFVPLLLSSFAFNFNNFGLIYLLTGGGPTVRTEFGAQATDILISWGYNIAFASGGGSAYGPASAVAIVIGVLTIGLSVFNFSLAGVFKEARK